MSSHRLIPEWFVLILLLVLAPGIAPGQPAKPLPKFPLIDVHSHLYKNEQNVDDLIAFMDANQIRQMAISGITLGESDEGVRRAGIVYPDRLLPFLRDFDPVAETSVAYVKNRLASGWYRGVGEIFLNGHGRSVRADHPVLQRIYEIAAERRVPVLLHLTIGSAGVEEPATTEQVRQLASVLSRNPKTMFILGHCGAGPLPRHPQFMMQLRYLLTRYPNLSLDISRLESEFFADDGRRSTIGTELLRLMIRFPHAFLVGFDLGDHWADRPAAARHIALFRLFLADLPPDVQRRVAVENAQAIFSRGPVPVTTPSK